MDYIYFFIFFSIGLLILILPVKIHISYERHNNIDKLKVKVKILFITFSKRLSAPFIKILSLLSKRKYTQDNINEALQQRKVPKKNWGLILRRMNLWFPRGMQIFSHSLKLASKIFKPIKCKKLKIYCEIGLFNAAQTGIALGGIWAILSFLFSQLSKWITINPQTPEVEIIPDFYNTKLNLKYDCIIVFPLGHIIIVMLQTVRFLRVSSVLLKNVTAYNTNSTET